VDRDLRKENQLRRRLERVGLVLNWRTHGYQVTTRGGYSWPPSFNLALDEVEAVAEGAES
jgi:hypothetical protein